jgi:hypothetical protein
MNDKLQDAALDALGLIGSAQWEIAFVARYGNKDFAAKAIENLQLAAAELQAALDEVKK